MSDNTDTGDTAAATAITTTTTTEVVHTDSENTNVPVPREALITTAVNFLQNAKVRHTTLMQKQQFLRSKGLTVEEIQLACERAGVFSQDPTVINMGISAQTHSQLALQPRQSTFGRLRELLNSVALFSGLAYAIYVFWKKFLEPFLFGRKKKPVDKALEDIEKKVDTRIDDVSRDITQLKESLSQSQREQVSQFSREFQTFRSDLEAIKGLLLNRKQFAAPLVGVGAPSIPAWQLSSATPQRHHHHRVHQHSQSDDNEKADDAGSGSNGSSETEVVTKNSDSSLEIM